MQLSRLPTYLVVHFHSCIITGGGKAFPLTSTTNKPHALLLPTTTLTRVLHILRITTKFISSSQRQPAEVHMQSLTYSSLIHCSIIPWQPVHHSLELSKSAKPAQLPSPSLLHPQKSYPKKRQLQKTLYHLQALTNWDSLQKMQNLKGNEASL